MLLAIHSLLEVKAGRQVIATQNFEAAVNFQVPSNK